MPLTNYRPAGKSPEKSTPEKANPEQVAKSSGGINVEYYRLKH